MEYVQPCLKGFRNLVTTIEYVLNSVNYDVPQKRERVFIHSLSPRIHYRQGLQLAQARRLIEDGNIQLKVITEIV